MAGKLLYSNICSNSMSLMTTPSASPLPDYPVPDSPVPDCPVPPHGGRPRSMQGDSPALSSGVLKAMSPGVVDFLFRQLVAGEPAEDVQWSREGTILAA